MIKTPKSGTGTEKRGGLASAASAMRQVVEQEASEDTRPTSPRRKAKTREGKRGLVLYVQPEVTVALRELALENGSDVQTMGHRALELLFSEFGRAMPGSRTSENKS